MRSRILTLAVALAAFFSLALGFIAIASLDIATTTRPGDIRVLVIAADTLDSAGSEEGTSRRTGSSGDAMIVASQAAMPYATPPSTASTLEAVGSIADSHQVSVFRTLIDAKHPESQRILYIHAGNDAYRKSWLSRGYPDVMPHAMSTTVRPLGQSVRQGVAGTYVITGGNDAARRSAARDMVDSLASQGYSSTATMAMTVGDLRSYASSDLVVAAVLALLMCALLASLGVFLDAQGHAVMRLHGFSWGRIWRRDVAKNAKDCILWTLAVLAAMLCTAGAVNRFAQLPSLLAVSGTCFLAFLLVIALFHSLCIGLCMTLPILPGLKGGIPLGQATLDMYVIRIPAAIMAMAAISSVALTGATASGLRSQLAQWGDAEEMGVLGGTRGSATAEQEDRLNEWRLEKITDGEAVICYKTPSPWPGHPELDMEETGLTESLGDVLIVNSAYLTRQTVLDSSGHRIDAAPDGEVLLIIPEERMGERESIEETVHSYLHPHWVTTQLLRAYGRDADAHVDADGHSEFEDQAGPDVTVTAGLQGQTVFAYQFSGMSARSDFENVRGPTVTDPVIIAMDVSSGVQNLYYDYNTYANAGSILYPDPDRMWGELTNLGLDSIVASLRTPTDALHAGIASCERILCVELLALILAVAVLAASGIALAQTHVRGRAQEVFVEYVHGWPFPRIHRLLIACEAGLFAVVLIAGAHRYQSLGRRSALYSYSQSYYAASVSAEIAAAAAVCVLSLAVCLAATALSTRSLCRRHAGAA